MKTENKKMTEMLSITNNGLLTEVYSKERVKL